MERAPMPIPDWIANNRDLMQNLPFVGMWVGQRAQDRPLLTRWLENAATAILAAALIMWRNDSVQDYKLETMQAMMRDVRADTRAEVAQLRADIAALRAALTIHHTTEQQQLTRRIKQ